MSFIKTNAPLLNIFQRLLDVGILLLITWTLAKWCGETALMRIMAIYGSVLMIIIFSMFNIYRSWRGVSLFSQIKTLLFAWMCVLLVFNVLLLLLSNKEQLQEIWPFVLFGIEPCAVWSLLVFLGIVVVRILTKGLLVYFRKRGFNQRRAYIVGAGEAGEELAKYLVENPGMGIRVLGFFDDRVEIGNHVKGSSNVLGEVIGRVDECLKESHTHNIDMVFITLPMREEEKISKLVWALGTKGVSVFLVPDLFTLGIRKASIYQLGELHLMDFNVFPKWKRTFDIIFSLMILIITTPVWLIIIVLVRREDGGAIFYRDPRIGESGKKFDAWKFRTMVDDAAERLQEVLAQNPAFREEYETTYKLKNDPRITKIGRFLRKTSLDELPQFINVIKGDMSVVGARPVLPPQFEAHYNHIALTYCATRPGITGPWQIGFRSDTEDYHERVALDHWYVLNCTFWLDLKIIFKTAWRVLRPKGAY